MASLASVLLQLEENPDGFIKRLLWDAEKVVRYAKRGEYKGKLAVYLMGFTYEFAKEDRLFLPDADDLTSKDWIYIQNTPESKVYARNVLQHISSVKTKISVVTDALVEKGKVHDISKFNKDEFDIMAENFPKLRDTTYGSPEYRELLEINKASIQLHYERNDHHPEYHPMGVNGMNLVNLVEMLCDWLAACDKHEDGDIFKSLLINKERFGLSDQLYEILRNTVIDVFGRECTFFK